MIRSAFHLLCSAFGFLMAMSIASFREEWAIVVLTLMIPWDKVFHFVDDTLHDHYAAQDAAVLVPKPLSMSELDNGELELVGSSPKNRISRR